MSDIGGVGWGGRLSTFSAFRMGAYSRWALNRGWAYSNKYGTLIPRNIWQWCLFSDTVCPKKKTQSRPLNCSFSNCWIFKGKNFQALHRSFNPFLQEQEILTKRKTKCKRFDYKICDKLLLKIISWEIVDCKTVGFFLKISKEIGNAWLRSLMRANRASLTRP